MLHSLRLASFSLFLAALLFSSQVASQEMLFKVGYDTVDIPLQQADGTTRPLTLALWYPTSGTPQLHTYAGPAKGQVAVRGPLDHASGPYPLLVFSHGYGGSGLSTLFLTEKLAARGWIVVATEHSDPDYAFRIRTGVNKNLDRAAFYQRALDIGHTGPEDRSKYMYRLQEMRTALNAALSMDFFRGAIDETKIAVGGHSFGGFTALGLCGTLDEWYDPRIKAALIYSSGASGYLYAPEELAKLRVPSIYFFGEKEKNEKRGEKTMKQLGELMFKSVPSPKHFLEVHKGTHFSFNSQILGSIGAWLLSGNETQFDVIRRYSFTFLDAYVKGDKRAEARLFDKDREITRQENVVTR